MTRRILKSLLILETQWEKPLLKGLLKSSLAVENGGANCHLAKLRMFHFFGEKKVYCALQVTSLQICILLRFWFTSVRERLFEQSFFHFHYLMLTEKGPFSPLEV